MSKHTRAAYLLFLAATVAPPAARGTITPANVASLALRWETKLPSVTGALVIANGLLYAPVWDAKLHALDPDTGAERWAFQAGSVIPGGVITVPGGNVCFGDWGANVYCIRGDDGSLVWQKNLQTGGSDAVWAQLGVANGRLFVGIASHSDQPCVQGRMVALDLATGNELWTLKTVPDHVCRNNTAISCTTSDDCGGDLCWNGIGGGVTATPLPDPTGEFVYMNTVGCFTSPSIGDSDSMFKVRASTGEVIWKRRVTGPEQFGYCSADSRVVCGTDANCATAGVGGTCTLPTDQDPHHAVKPYHDFGFLNGPVRIEVPANGGGTKTLIVSGSKDGTLYAFNEVDGTIAWTNPVLPVPAGTGFAGFGLFNGAIVYTDGRIHAALNALIPKRVCDNDHIRGCNADENCSAGDHCLPTPPHLMAFSPIDGARLWADDIGESWSSVAVVNGVVYAGTNALTDETAETSTFFAYDAASGTRLATFPLPSTSASKAAVVGDTLFVGSGGGVTAFGLCGNSTIDPGEECDPGFVDTHGCCSPTCRLVGGPCDDGNACHANGICVIGHCEATIAPGAPCTPDDDVCTDAVCDHSGACVQQPNTAACDDGDACTSGDRCANDQCAGRHGTPGDVACVVDRIVDKPCGDTALPKSLAKAVGGRLAAVHKLLDKADALAAKGKTAKAGRLKTSAATRITGIKALTAKAVASHNASRRISADCKGSIDALVDSGQGVVSAFAF